MANLQDGHLNKWNWDSLAEDKGGRGSVVLDGALFAHTDATKAYYMSDSSGAGVRFELRRADIGDVTPLDNPLRVAGQSFQRVRFLLRLDGTVVRSSLHVADALVEYPEKSMRSASGEILEMKNTVLANVIMR